MNNETIFILSLLSGGGAAIFLALLIGSCYYRKRRKILHIWSFICSLSEFVSIPMDCALVAVWIAVFSNDVSTKRIIVIALYAFWTYVAAMGYICRAVSGKRSLTIKCPLCASIGGDELLYCEDCFSRGCCHSKPSCSCGLGKSKKIRIEHKSLLWQYYYGYSLFVSSTSVVTHTQRFSWKLFFVVCHYCFNFTVGIVHFFLFPDNVHVYHVIKLGFLCFDTICHGLNLLPVSFILKESSVIESSNHTPVKPHLTNHNNISTPNSEDEQKLKQTPYSPHTPAGWTVFSTPTSIPSIVVSPPGEPGASSSNQHPPPSTIPPPKSNPSGGDEKLNHVQSHVPVPGANTSEVGSMKNIINTTTPPVARPPPLSIAPQNSPPEPNGIEVGGGGVAPLFPITQPLPPNTQFNRQPHPNSAPVIPKDLITDKSKKGGGKDKPSLSSCQVGPLVLSSPPSDEAIEYLEEIRLAMEIEIL
eukprot:PhF_6_TR32184/c0_g1_i3/m.47781